MRVSYLFLCLVVAGLTTQQACTEQKVDPISSANCPEAGAFAKEVKSVTGLVGYFKPKDLYFLQVATSNLDALDLGFVCNLPDEYKEEGLQITFSGKYYHLKESLKLTAGSSSYYLDLSQLEKVKTP